MKPFLTFIFFLLTNVFLFGQIRTTQEVKPLQFELLATSNLVTKWIEPLSIEKEVFSFAVKSKTTIHLQFRTKKSGKKISQWKNLELNSHRQTYDQYWVSELYFLSVETEGIQFRHLINKRPQSPIEINFISIPIGYASEKSIQSDSSTCACEQPAYFNREDWCPTNDCPEISNPAITSVTHLIVHHAASANTSSNWAGVVKSIWEFHVNVNGWDDIGYNWLVDPEGKIYQGRGDNVRGAHFCGTNSGTMGVCMLGNFQTQAPQDSALEMLTKLLAWKSCDVDITPTDSSFHSSSGLILNTISGHKQGCSTACPGDLFFPLFPELRLAVESYIADSCKTIFSNINNRNENLEISLFPNPAIDNITITSSQKFTFFIIDSKGIIIHPKTKKALNKINLDIDQFSEGVYFLYIKSGEQFSVEKFTVLRAN